MKKFALVAFFLAFLWTGEELGTSTATAGEVKSARTRIKTRKPRQGKRKTKKPQPDPQPRLTHYLEIRLPWWLDAGEWSPPAEMVEKLPVYDGKFTLSSVALSENHVPAVVEVLWWVDIEEFTNENGRKELRHLGLLEVVSQGVVVSMEFLVDGDRELVNQKFAFPVPWMFVRDGVDWYPLVYRSGDFAKEIRDPFYFWVEGVAFSSAWDW